MFYEFRRDRLEEKFFDVSIYDVDPTQRYLL